MTKGQKKRRLVRNRKFYRILRERNRQRESAELDARMERYRPAMDEYWKRLLAEHPEAADSDEASVGAAIYAALATCARSQTSEASF